MNHPHMKLTTLLVLAIFALFPAYLALPGSLEPSGSPAPTMKTLQEIFDKLELIDNKVEPQGFVYIPRTGQTPTVPVDPAPAGSDGNLQKGLAWPSPRFTDNGDGTVTDNLTKLVWLKNANCDGTKNWADALAFANDLKDGDHGLSDGSAAGDWRLPNIRELLSLADYGQDSPALPSGHPFLSVPIPGWYWSSTTRAGDDVTIAWNVDISTGRPDFTIKGSSASRYAWPVRGGQ